MRAAWPIAVVVALLVSSCGDDCVEGAVAQNGICMPACPSVSCGDGICARYILEDGAWDDSLRCEDHRSCPADCDNRGANLADVIFYALLAIDDADFVPNPAQAGTSVSGPCEDGGQVSVTGMHGCRDLYGVTSCIHDFTYTFASCAYESPYPRANVTFVSGSITGHWEYIDEGEDTSVVYDISGSVVIEGEVTVGYVLDDPALVPLAGGPCEVDFVRAISGGMPSVTTGEVCGESAAALVYQP